MEKLLELENVSYSYQDGKEKNQILDHASYLFEKGKIYAVVGASGSGKTTTLSLASGLDKPDDGKVLFKGKDIQEIQYIARGKYLVTKEGEQVFKFPSSEDEESEE